MLNLLPTQAELDATADQRWRMLRDAAAIGASFGAFTFILLVLGGRL